jgi:hypothetical protein
MKLKNMHVMLYAPKVKILLARIAFLFIDIREKGGGANFRKEKIRVKQNDINCHCKQIK